MSLYGGFRWKNSSGIVHAQNKENMKKTLAILLGFLASPLVPAGYFAIVYPISGYRDPISIVGTFVVTYIFAITGVAVLGAPIFLLLNKLKLIRWWSAASSGALLGIVLRLAITSGNNVDSDSMWLFVVLGGIAGFVFWMFWRIGEAQKTGGTHQKHRVKPNITTFSDLEK